MLKCFICRKESYWRDSNGYPACGKMQCVESMGEATKQTGLLQILVNEFVEDFGYHPKDTEGMSKTRKNLPDSV